MSSIRFAGCRWVGRRWITFLVIAIISLWAQSVRASSVTFTYTTPAACTTSAGVYRSDGTLIRTLWNNQPTAAGANTGLWDGFDDNRQPVPSAVYQVKVLTHNVTYTWEGFIGNTSTSQTGNTTLRMFQSLQDMTITDTAMYAVSGYNEGGGVWINMALSNPNAVTSWGPMDFFRNFLYTATDGTLVYFANYSTVNLPAIPSFVSAIDASTGAAHNFTTSTNTWGGTQGYHWNAIDYQEGMTNIPSGLAVQKTGSYLFVAHSAENVIHVLNKSTGAAVSSAAVTAPGRIAVTTDGNLWVLCSESGSTVARLYSVDGSGMLTATTAVVTGLVNPLALAISPDNSTLAIVDGGSSQQVKAFSNVSSGTPTALWTLGLAGGYNATNGPDVSTTKFCFDAGTFIAFQSDGSFWLGDGMNQRYLHFASDRSYIGQFAYIDHNYVAPVCDADPTRVFACGWLEYAVDYSQPIGSCWTLVKNWRAGLPSNYFPGIGTNDGFHSVIKLSNGRTYATASSDGTTSRVLLELPASGCARQTGVSVTGKTLHEDGSLRWQTTTSTTATYNRQDLTGFDASNNPVWGTAYVMASVPRMSFDPISTGFTGSFGPRFPITSSNILVTANMTGAYWNYHLGAIKLGSPSGTDWLWKAAPSGVYYDEQGTVGDSTYPANAQFAKGQNIVFCSHGEGYEGSQAQQFLHFWDDGLMVGEFGRNFDDASPDNTEVAGHAGNSISSSLVQYGSDLYMWVNDEWGTGMHLWKINNPSSIVELAPINVTMNSSSNIGSGEGLTGEYFTGINFDTLSAERTDPTVNFTWSGSPITGVPADNFSVRWSGLVEPRFTENYTFYTQSDAGVRLYVNGVKIIDNWTAHGSTENASPAVSLVAGQRYKIVMEYYDTTGTAVAQLRWSSTSQSKQPIPLQQLYPSDAVAVNCGGPSVSRFQADPAGITGSGIMITTNSIDLSGATDPAPMSVYQAQRKFGQSYSFGDLKPFTNYKVRIHMAELYTADFGVGKRLMPLTINGLGSLSPVLDPYALAGAGYKAAVQETVVSTGSQGVIDLKFTSTSTLLAGLELERDPSDAAANPSFALEGRGSGLQGVYYSGTSFGTQVGARIDRELNFLWGTGSPIAGLGGTNYTVRWTGKLLSSTSGAYSFLLTATAGARLWVNGTLVVDSWSVSGGHSGSITLNPSQLYDIKVEYQNTAGSSALSLMWKRPGDAIYSVIPQFQLYPPPVVSTTILDNAATSGVTLNGAWTVSSSVGDCYATNYVHDGNAGKGTKSVAFTPNLPATATYNVYEWHSAGTNRAASVPITITYAGGSATVNVNQQINGGQWILLGNYSFNAGTGGSVTVSNTGTSGFVIGDAVKFEQQ